MKNSMKKILMTVFFLTVISFGINGQTNVSGFINANTTWDLAGSPYIVTGNALLSHGYTLIINPGVVIKFDSDKALQIDGELIAIGTPQNRITFTSNQSMPQAGDWAKLHFADTCVNATFDSFGNYTSGCILKYCDVLYGGGLGYGAIDVEYSSPYFSHCKILYSAASGVYYNCVSATIDSSSIRNCADYGIYFETGHFLMQNDSITNNIQGGIVMNQQYDGFQSKVLHCYFAYNNYAINWEFNGIQHTTISDNYFINNTGIVVAPFGHHDTLTCNKFINNQNGPAISFGGSCCPMNGGLIFNNLFEGNINPTGPSVIEVGAGYPTGDGDTLIFANNIIRNNSSINNSCCIFYSYLFYFVNTEFLRIYDNIFTNNIGSNLIEMQGDQNSNASYDFLYMKNNTFSNPLCQYELYNDIPYGAPNLYLDSNYWGSTSTQHIDSVIYDYFDFANQSVVYYLPILTSMKIIDTTCRPFQDSAVDINEINESQNYFLLYPNPASDYLTLRFAQNTSYAEIKIYNLLGELKSTSIKSSTESMIDISDLSNGVYIIEVTTEKNIMRQKFIKQ